MATRYYLAVADRDPQERRWSILFPSFPGVTSTAARPADLLREASDALASAVEAMAELGLALPPSIEDDAIPDYDALGLHQPIAMLAPVEVPGRAMRVNVSMDEGLLARLDASARRTHTTRSALLARGARMVLAAEG
jgi:predicted RNase H-like HicB family nuclease